MSRAPPRPPPDGLGTERALWGSPRLHAGLLEEQSRPSLNCKRGRSPSRRRGLGGWGRPRSPPREGASAKAPPGAGVAGCPRRAGREREAGPGAGGAPGAALPLQGLQGVADERPLQDGTELLRGGDAHPLPAPPRRQHSSHGGSAAPGLGLGPGRVQRRGRGCFLRAARVAGTRPRCGGPGLHGGGLRGRLGSPRAQAPRGCSGPRLG